MDLNKSSVRAELRKSFLARFGGRPRGLRCALSPGRVNLIGEHTDYNGGFVLPMAIARHTAVLFRPLGRPYLRIHAADIDRRGEPDDEFCLTRRITRLNDPKRYWANYVRGVAAVLKRRGIRLKGGELYIHADLPQGAGLSSSASLEVASAMALLTLAGRKMQPQKVALACQKAEHTFAGVRCGIMDQSVVTRARRGHALLLDCVSLHVRHVPIRLKKWSFAVFDTGVRHKLAGSEYNKRRAECERAARRFGVKTLRHATVAHLMKTGHKLTAGEHRRVRHVLTEDLRTAQFAAALARGDVAELGHLLYAGHASLRDDYQVSCPELDFIVETLRRASAGPVRGGCAGARMTGGGFGGSVVALVRPRSFPALRTYLARQYLRYKKRKLGGALLLEPSAGVTVARC
jgi:galactokinase